VLICHAREELHVSGIPETWKNSFHPINSPSISVNRGKNKPVKPAMDAPITVPGHTL
jgi:hypothetical protein